MHVAISQFIKSYCTSVILVYHMDEGRNKQNYIIDYNNGDDDDDDDGNYNNNNDDDDNYINSDDDTRVNNNLALWN